MKGRFGGLAAIGALLVAPMATACGSDDTAGPDRGVTVSDLQKEEYFFEGDYLGRTVTVTARVAEVPEPDSFELSGGDFGDATLLVSTGDPVEVTKGEVVRVTGTVGQFHESFPVQGVPYIQESLYSKHATESYLYDASVEPLAPTS
jgi:hypothetical protein